MNVVNLVVVAHPDDEILGFGGTGTKLVARGETVKPIVLCGGVDVRDQRPEDEDLAHDIEQANLVVGFDKPILGIFPNIRMNAIPHVELVQFIERQIVTLGPTRIFTHHPSDLNDDHRQTSRACMAAFRLFQRRSDISPIRSLHFMEIQSATDWALDPSLGRFTPNLYVEIEGEIDKKLDALSRYRHVMRPYPHPRSDEAIRGLAAYRGAQCGSRLAEAFQTVFQREVF